jgi:uncharacterized metal-binding protein YceD (DUF177 family)
MRRVDAFKIYVDQLRDGHAEEIDETFPPDFLDVHEEALDFSEPVKVKGQVYLAGDELVLHFDLLTYGQVPCSICNEPVRVAVNIPNFYYAEPLSEIKSGIFNYSEVIREAILLETPSFAECNEGECPRRRELKKYLKEPTEGPEGEDRYHPFADL